MEETLRETKKYEFVRCMYNRITVIYEKATNKQTYWNTDKTAIRDEINYVKHLSNDEFDTYASNQIKIHNKESEEECCS